MQRYAIYAASGRYEMNGDEPSVEDMVDAFDAALEAEPMAGLAAADVEFLQLMGIS